MTSKSSSTKPLLSIHEQRLKMTRQKEETLRTVLTSAKDNPKFIKLLIYSLNSLENFITPPNREIRINASIIIRLEGVGILQTITLKNITNEEIVFQAGNILWKLISLYGKVDHELAKLFADNNGQEAVITILLKKQTANSSEPYIKILNGLVQIPQLVSRLLNSGITDTVKIVNDTYTDDDGIMAVNFDTMKKISNQRVGRESLINKQLVRKALENIKECMKRRNYKAVFNGLTVIDNLCRNDNGKEAIKNANGIEILSEVIEISDNDNKIIKKCARIYTKIACVDDLMQQFDILKQCYTQLQNGDSSNDVFNNINKCLLLISNFMLVGEMCKVVTEQQHTQLLEDVFTHITSLHLNETNIHSLLMMNKFFMVIFYRGFNYKPEVFLPKAKEATLLSKIQQSLQPIWKDNKNNIINNDTTRMNFIAYYNAYNDVLNLQYKEQQTNMNESYIQTIMFILEDIITNGKDVFKDNTRANFTSTRVIKNATELAQHTATLNNNVESTYEYLMHLFKYSNDNDTLSNVLDVLYSLLQSNINEFRNTKMNEIVEQCRMFSQNKHSIRYPSYVCLKIFEMQLTDEFIVQLQAAKENVKYVECIVKIMTNKYYDNMLNLKAQESKKELNEQTDIMVYSNDKLEHAIDELGSALLLKLIKLETFKHLLKEYIDMCDKFNPEKTNEDEVTALTHRILLLESVMDVKQYFTEGVDATITATKNLISKEVSYCESYKRDKDMAKLPQYHTTLQTFSERISIELALIDKIHDIAYDNSDYTYLKKTYETFLLYLSKASDANNVTSVLTLFTTNAKFIINNENAFVINDNKKEQISEKIANSCIVLLRRLIEDENGIIPIIETMIAYAKLKISICNILVKSGCTRLLLQILDTTPNASTAELVLELLKLIALSNHENLTMIANQNVLSKFYELRSKFAGNFTIASYCDVICNEIMKIPGQDNYARDVVIEAINEFNENSKLDYSDNETKSKLLLNLEVINSFTTNEKQIALLLMNEHFENNLNTITDKTLSDNEITQINEKLIANELTLIAKMVNNIASNSSTANNVITLDVFVNKLMTIIKTKSNYRDIFLHTARYFSKYIKDETLYNQYLSNTIDTDFIDTLFDISDNYLDDVQVSKELNNILCYLCLRNDKLADYIKQKGGLNNVLEDLKANLDLNDDNSRTMKMNSLRMLSSLCKDDNSMKMFIKADGRELLNNIIKNEMQLLNINDNNSNNDDVRCSLRTNECIQLTPHSYTSLDKHEYIAYCVDIIKNGIEKGHNTFNDVKMLRNCVLIANRKYPCVKLVHCLCETFNLKDVNVNDMQLHDVLVLMKVLFSMSGFCEYREGNDSEKEMIIEMTKLLKKVQLSKEYFKYVNEHISTVDKDKLNDDNKSVTYVGIGCCKYENEFNNEESMKSIYQLYNSIMNIYVDKSTTSNTLHDAVNQGVVISLIELTLALYKHNSNMLYEGNTDVLIRNLLYLGDTFYNKQNPNFIKHFINKMNTLFTLIGTKDKSNALLHSSTYISYLHTTTSKSLKYIVHYNKHFNSVNQTQSEALRLIIANAISYYTTNQDEDNKTKISKELVNALLQTVDNINKSNDNSKEHDELLSLLWQCICLILQSKDGNVILSDSAIIQQIFTLLKPTDKQCTDPNTYAKIINAICQHTENNPETFQQAMTYITDDLSQMPPLHEDTNLDSLLNLSKYSTAMKTLLKNKQLIQILRNMYDNDALPRSKRRKLANIYSNIMKNSYNVDTLLNEDPETFKVIGKKVSTAQNVIKDDDDVDIAETEIETVVTIMKDDNNYNQLTTNQLISDNELTEYVKVYTGVNKRLDSKIEDVQCIINSHANMKKEQTDVKMDEALLEELKKKIEDAFNKHITMLEEAETKEQIVGDNENDNNNDNCSIRLLNDIITEKITKTETTINTASPASPPSQTTTNNVKQAPIKKGRLSVVSHNLFYNPNNDNINSPLSTRFVEEMTTSLDSILALIRLMHNANKTSTDKTLIQKRNDLIIEALHLLKLMSICPDNHKAILELGVINFMERLITVTPLDNIDIYISTLEVLKNCTWSESAVLILLDSPFFDYLIKEVLNLYANPAQLSSHDKMKLCFTYDNMTFTNICKCSKGFDSVFKLIGIDKLRSLGLQSDNIDMLNAIIEMIINYVGNNKDNVKADKHAVDFLTIANKGLTSPDKNGNVFSKGLKLIGMVYNDELHSTTVESFNIVQHINSVFALYKNEIDFLMNCIYTLAIISLNNTAISTHIVDSGLLDNIVNEIKSNETYSTNINLVEHLSLLYKNLLINNERNRSAMCTDNIINNITHYINVYSQKIPRIQTVYTVRSRATINSKVLMGVNTKDESKATKYEELSIENKIMINLITALDYLTIEDGSIVAIANSNFLKTLMQTIEKPNAEFDVVKISLHAMSNFFHKKTSKYWKHSEIDQLYNILKALQKQYYANSDILILISQISGYILKGFDSPIYTEKYYLLIIDNISCQDWNYELIVLSLLIIKDAIKDHQSLHQGVFDITKNLISNLLRLYFNNHNVQCLCYEILSEFAKDAYYGYFITNGELLSLMKEALNCEEINAVNEHKVKLRQSMMELICVLSSDEGNSRRLSGELMETLLKELDKEYSEDMIVIAKTIGVLLRYVINIEPFTSFMGAEIMVNILNKHYDNVELLLRCFTIISAYIQSSKDCKKKVTELQYEHLIMVILDKNKEHKKLQFEGECLLSLIRSFLDIKAQFEPIVHVVDPTVIVNERKIKGQIKEFLTKGKDVKVVTPKGKMKEMHLMFTYDLMKVYCKKLKVNLIPKLKYTLETMLIDKAVKGHATDAFKKTKSLFSKGPKKEHCFSIISVDGKSINVECENESEVDILVNNVNAMVEYMKKKINSY